MLVGLPQLSGAASFVQTGVWKRRIYSELNGSLYLSIKSASMTKSILLTEVTGQPHARAN
jgi:hypothetical protein